jgi:DNA-binding transcriptional LysR family regulator
MAVRKSKCVVSEARLQQNRTQTGMELYQLRTFVAVAETQSVTRAAERLYTTPPSVSAHIKALEAELRVALFVRTPRGMTLTPQGEQLRHRAETALQAAEALLSAAVTLQQELVGELNLGVNSTPQLLRLPELLTTMQESHRRLRLNLMSCVSGRVGELLRSGTLDLAFLFGGSTTPDLLFESLGQVELIVAAPLAWEPYLRRGRWEEIAALPWIASTVDCPFEALSDALFCGRGLTPHKVALSDDGVTKLGLIRAGVGVALLERMEAEAAAAQGGIALWAPQPLFCTLGLACLERRRGEPALTAVRQAIRQIWETDLSL